MPDHAPPELDFAAELKRRLEDTRLPVEVKEQILANLPPVAERQRLFQDFSKMAGFRLTNSSLLWAWKKKNSCDPAER